MRKSTSSRHIPVARTTLIGRERELSTLDRLFRDQAAGLVTIVGPGGVGKTRLALEFAARMRRTGETEVVFVQLAELHESSLAASAIRDALSPDLAGTVSESSYLDDLRTRSLVLILDNLEQVVGAAALIATLLDAGPEIRVLATSRSPLRIAGEQEFPLTPLSVEEDVLKSDAVALFADRARSVDPAFKVSAANIDDVAAICRRLDGLPLAIELAAARTKVLPPANMLARLMISPLNPGPGRRDAPERQQTLPSAIDWSYRLLNPDEQRLVRLLSVFAGSFSIESAESLWTRDRSAPAVLELFDGVAQLVDHSLLRRLPTEGGDRFAMLQTIRSFAEDQALIDGERDDLRDAHALYFTELAEEIVEENGGGVPSRAMAAIHLEIDNVRVALQWSFSRIDKSAFLRLVAALGGYWFSRGSLSEATLWTERAMESVALAEPATRLRLFNSAGWLSSFRGDHAEAVERCRIALQLAVELGDVQQQVSVLNAQGGGALYRGDIPGAIHFWGEGVRLGQTSKTPVRIAGVAHNLALAYLYNGDIAQARATREMGLIYIMETEDPELQLFSALLLAEIEIGDGNLVEAFRLLGQVADTVDDASTESVIIDIAAIAGSLAVALGRHEDAAYMIGASKTMRARLGFAISMADEVVDRDHLTVLRAVLGAERLVRTMALGASLTPGEIDERLRALEPFLPAGPSVAPHGLSARELDVLRLLGSGETNQEIAARLFISPRTVQSHVANILAKLDAPTRAAAVAIAVKDRLV